MFTTGGAVGNTGASYITGNIGTNSGPVNSFGDKAPNSNVNGYVDGLIYLQETKGSKGTFSIYQNGVLIPSSVRTRTNTVDTVDISLLTLATVAAGQPIEVRWNVDFGSLELKNRTFSILNLR
jgi:hypothetical protein